MKCDDCGMCASALSRPFGNVCSFKNDRSGYGMTIAFCGNPNCGKTSLFNIYTGSNLKVGNWPGVTVERREGKYIIDVTDVNNRSGEKYKLNNCKKEVLLVDLPGIYSLSSYTAEEKIAYDYIANENADIILNIADASSLYRSLYLTLSLINMNIPVALVLNMIDIAHNNGMKIDVRKLEKKLGIPVLCSSARTGEGVSKLIETVISDKRIIDKRKKHMLLGRGYGHGKEGENNKINSDVKIYEEINRILSDVIFFEKAISGKIKTAAIDRVILNRFFCVPLFFFIMFTVFFLTFVVGNGIKELLSGLISILESGVRAVICRFSVSELASGLILEGVIPGLSGVLTFMPVLLVMFFLIALLEESGYLSRVSYIMNRIMLRFGLSGRAVIPLMLGFGCTIPAVFAARTIENEKDRHKTVLVLSYMSCGARLPLYLTLSGAFFGVLAPTIIFVIYLIGIFTAILTLLIEKKIANGNGKENRDNDENELLIELPDFKLPSMKNVLLTVKIKIAGFVKKAGTVIFAMSVFLWLMTHLNLQGFCSNINDSFAVSAGRCVAFLLKPCGIGYWQTALPLLLGIAAKEMTVSSLGLIFGINNISSSEGVLELNAALSQIGFYPVSAFCMMLFSLLYLPCAAALAVIKKECGTLRMVLYALIQTFTAWIACNIVYLVFKIYCCMTL